MRTQIVTVLAAVLCLFAAIGLAAEKTPPDKGAGVVRALRTETRPWKGDFDGMLERRRIRVLIPYSRTLYYNDKGREGGIAVDIVRDFERYLNRKYAKQLGKRPLTVFIYPSTRDVMLQKVADGLGDVAAGDLDVTDARSKILDFWMLPDWPVLAEIVVTGPTSPVINTADELAGKTVHARRNSGYYESLLALNDRFEKDGKPAMKIVLVPDALEDEDMMELVNAGIINAIVVHDWKARLWAQVLPGIKVNEGAAVRAGGHTGWGGRKGSPQLLAVLADFGANFEKKQQLFAVEYHKQIKQIRDSGGAGEKKRFEDTIALFETYGARYGFDPLLLAAQGFQESQLNQDAKSANGAIGIMQLMPATGVALKVGDIRIAEHNVHAGAKYMDMLITRYFADARFTEMNRELFAFAAYNSGPGNIARMRNEAGKRGLDPDRWFNNVEIVAAEKIGAETTTYVRNIFKYYIGYRLLRDEQEAEKKAREAVR